MIRNTRLGMTGKKHQTKLAHLMIYLKSQLIDILVAVTRNKNFPLADHKIRIFFVPWPHKTSSNHQKNKRLNNQQQPSKLPDQEPGYTKDKEIETFRSP